MELSKQMDQNLLNIGISGELDASSAIILDDAMKEALEQETKEVIIDCAALDYISSAGLGVFISYMDQFKEKNAQFVLFNMQEQVYSVFQILGLDKVVTITTNEDEARAKLNEG
jgi:anti-sigma B factor antagonist